MAEDGKKVVHTIARQGLEWLVRCMHKKGLVSVHVPGANGPKCPRMKRCRNRLVAGRWQGLVLHTKCTLSANS